METASPTWWQEVQLSRGTAEQHPILHDCTCDHAVHYSVILMASERENGTGGRVRDDHRHRLHSDNRSLCGN